mmetsp:Transcript_25792/g.39525  ORF Transcript_25792/g.39525 Transcript_25792/m.39525 type:complete len:387 (-) Transcript_25792:101-1261(-)|eukprot:CAMPEP_0194088502 /NCGR_PEP_ID=MMETSP0149-20130528/29385_1 /TAXON_ID=122233 /ORGANISM="Chaetoceros debilis, Strain MM31A-1" /LENGTH=386 /DNA_ID=CAMNT_0038772165 /DNA_START=28 /DNA_END=1188 /DNA_ORIENTATION=-
MMKLLFTACVAVLAKKSGAFTFTARNAFSLTTSTRTGSSSTTSSLKATWSNGQAIKEYQDFLASGKQEIEKEEDGPSVIVKSGTLNEDHPFSLIPIAISSLRNGDDVIVTPGSPLPLSMGDKESYPIYIAVPPFELDQFITSLPDDWKLRRDDFVFLSGGKICGVIEPILKKHGYARDSMSQLLCGGFTTPGATGRPQDLSCKVGIDASGEDKWAGETSACGKWSGAVAERFENQGIRCKTGFYREWRRDMWERASFDAVLNLIGAIRKEPTTLKDVALYYEPEASDMFWQVTSNLRGMLAVTLSYGFEERIFGFAEQRFSEQQCEITEEMFLYVYCAPINQGNMVNEYLNYAKDEIGLIPNVALRSSVSRPSLMRQGNLRADGNI